MQTVGQHGQGLQAASSAYTAWLTGTAEAAGHDHAFTDTVGAEAAVTGWRRHLVRGKASPASINQALAAVKLLYAQSGLRIEVKPARLPRPGEPDTLTAAQQDVAGVAVVRVHLVERPGAGRVRDSLAGDRGRRPRRASPPDPFHRKDARARRERPTGADPSVNDREPRGETMSENKRVVERYITGFNASDHEQILACLTDDIEWTVFGHYRITGKAAYDANIEGPDPAGVPPKVTITRMVEQDDVVMAEMTLEALQKDGSVLRAAMAEVFVMRDGLIRERRAYVIPLTENDHK
ncbi:nuclear transport factor 2 family protein [Nonomuraea sp. NPDC050790]|uniref:nuclear transport factor 2 family protein n=1 Tax=Nonomuraea sp. NPDC050790 TaxID=3364371 RepID=UPI00378FD4BC